MSEEKSQRIIEAAIRQFATQGYLKAKTATIAQEAQVSKGLIFHNFQTKQHLYTTIVALAIERLEQEMAYDQRDFTSLSDLFSYSMKLKFQLGAKYPNEIKVLIDAYSHQAQFPSELAIEINNYMEESRSQSYRLVTQLLDKIPLRATLNKERIVEMVMMVFNQLELEAKAMMSQEKVTDLDFMDEMVRRADEYLGILESGFRKDAPGE